MLTETSNILKRHVSANVFLQWGGLVCVCDCVCVSVWVCMHIHIEKVNLMG